MDPVFWLVALLPVWVLAAVQLAIWIGRAVSIRDQRERPVPQWSGWAE